MTKTIKNRYINCIVHNSSEGNILLGDDFTAFFDPGMAFCADKTIEKAKKALAGRKLDYIFATHTHYDHIGALPFFRAEWKDVKLITSEVGAGVLIKETPRRVIRELSIVAAKTNNVILDTSYSDEVFKADIIVKEKDLIELGDITVEVIETPGHTRDALSYFIKELGILILSETPGVLLPDKSMYPCYLTSYNDTMCSIEKCKNIPYKYLSLPHRGIISSEDAEGFFEKAASVNNACRDFILKINKENLSEEEMIELFYKEYGSEVLLSFQPKEAFIANARAAINCTLKEFDLQ